MQQLESLLADQGIEVAGIEFIRDHQGTPYVFDCNVINTNYNSAVEQALGVFGFKELAAYVLGSPVTETTKQ